MGKSDRYSDWGSREDYLMSLADEYGLDYVIVESLADVLGPNEDFDGLITTLEDYIDGGYTDL